MRRVVHVHLHRTGDAAGRSLSELYEDLAHRMLAAAAELEGKTRDARTTDDLQGHAFHGNQWTGGIAGPHKDKPTKEKVAHLKGGFAKMHALLSSGHPFSKQEMIDAAGLSSEKKLTDYLAMLKNAKYAGKLGALQIEKNQDGHYFVALPSGQPAPPLDGIKEGNDLTELLHAHLTETPHVPTSQAFVEKATAAPPPKPAPAPPPAAPAPTPAPLTGISALTAAHPGSMPKAEADKHYQDALDDAYSIFSAAKVPPFDAALTFKNQKAKAMAAWATAVHGHAYEPKPQMVHKADLQLVEDAKAFSKAAALNNWKANTAAEKHGNFPPKPAAAPVSKTATHVAPVADMGHPAPVKPVDYHTLVPASFVPIGEKDITDGHFGKGIASLKEDLVKQGAANAVANKKTIEHRLRERLKDAPNFQALSKRLGLAKEGTGSLEARLISTWAGSSGDHNHLSVSMQLAVRDAFGIPDGHVEKKALHSLQSLANDEAKVVSEGIQMLNSNITPLKPSEIPVAKAALMEFAQAQYHETQALLKEMGHDHVYLARGMKLQANHDAADGPAALKLQPASSFSTNYNTAKQFAGHAYGTVFVTKVPRQQVLSTYVTGFGCTSEHEVVVLAHEKMKAYAVSSGAAGGHTQAQQLLKQQVLAKKPKAPAPSSLEEHQAKIMAKYFTPAAKATPASVEAAKKAVINAKSKAYKALKAAEATKHPAKIAHAEKAAAEAQAAVAAYNSLKGKK